MGKLGQITKGSSLLSEPEVGHKSSVELTYFLLGKMGWRFSGRFQLDLLNGVEISARLFFSYQVLFDWFLAR